MRTCSVIGIGCDDHGDQIAGLLVARQIAHAAREGFRGVESSGAPAELIGAWRDVDRAVIVEAMPGEVPGMVQHCQPHPLRVSAGCSLAALSPRVRQALALGPLPSEVFAYTIAAQSFAPNATVTPLVAAAVKQVADLILADAPATDAPPDDASTPVLIGAGAG